MDASHSHFKQVLNPVVRFWCDKMLSILSLPLFKKVEEEDGRWKMARICFLGCPKNMIYCSSFNSFVQLLRHVCRVARNRCNFSASRRRGSAELHHEGPGSAGSLLHQPHQPHQPQAQDQNPVLQTGTLSEFNLSRINPEQQQRWP